MRILLVSALAAFALSAPASVTTTPEKIDGWRSLFDGTTTAGWRGLRQRRMPDGRQHADRALTRVAGPPDHSTDGE